VIHPTAIVDPGAVIADDVEIGPYSIIGTGVEIGPGCRIKPHVVIMGPTKIGRGNTIFQFASIGEDPQDKKYKPGRSELVIGDNNLIREYTTINRGTEQGGGVTTVGNDNWIMAYSHIAHDCIVGNGTIFANGATLAGHVEIKDHVIMGAYALAHQFCTVGEYSFISRATAVTKDVPPYLMVSGYWAEPRGINLEGLRRHGFSSAQIRNIKNGYRLLYKSKLSLSEAKEEIAKLAAEHEELRLFSDFLGKLNRSIIR